MFHTVGMLREILKNYSDDPPLLVYQAHGLGFFEEEGQYTDVRNIFPEKDSSLFFTYPGGSGAYRLNIRLICGKLIASNRNKRKEWNGL